ncbi:acyltransferase [Rhodococcus sp. 05-2255-1e]|uniref:acyltransferase n=1 Tax=Rhodococcus sp. 05-2255-1e TaxID=2022495 RepID=UPI000B9BF5FB
MHNVIIGAEINISIGKDVLIAEQVSIRDGNHGTQRGTPITRQKVDAEPITIQDDCWIARGCAILKGSRIGAGAVIGANSVVMNDIPAYAVAVGAPATVKKFRH